MNLTLHNILRWLDDQLTLEECREVGRMVESSEVLPYVAKILRLNHEPLRADETAEDAADPNRICDYLEDALTHDETVAFEHQCFSSEALFAEVVSVHRIVSLLGKKRRVPPQAQARLRDLGPAD